ncbi:MAG: M20/M25/M40 family metallo-hydrolase [Planctomycetota bacterium]|nr:M20/M25/M40 family metallo-hydrolase [Planctomycetota bacterium]
MRALLALSVAASLAAFGVAQAEPEPVGQRIRQAVAAVDPAKIEQTIRGLTAFGTRHVLSRTDDAKQGTGAARRWLKKEYESLVEASGGRLQVAFQSAKVQVRRRGMPREVEVVNVIATLPGVSDPDRVYVISGHYDSRNSTGADGEGLAPGANDDASGTAVALEACRVLCAQRFAATLVFCAYDGEEQGLLGSAAHAAELAAGDAQVDGMITCDIVGNTLGMDGKRYRDYVRCFSYAPSGNDSSGRSLARVMSYAARTYVPELAVKLIFRGDRYGRGGDHRSFFNEGFPAVRMTEPREDYSRQHQDITERDGKPYGDLADFVDFAYTANVTRIVVAAVGELASAPRLPLVRRVRGARDAYDILVDFQVADGVEDFEFVWRETTAPDWQGVVAKEDAQIQNATRAGRLQATLEGLCIDDVVVGVRSIGADGARSRVATPPEPDRML